MDNLGELAALGTAVLWSGTALCFEAAGRRIGSLSVNLLRFPIAFTLLALVGLWRQGQILPWDAGAQTWMWLTLSGLIGFSFGDLCLFRAFVLIGPRLSSLIMVAAPVFTAIFGWIFLDEVLSLAQWGAMAMVVLGIAWAISDRTPQRDVAPSARGVLLALGGALGQATGFVIAKHGMGDYDAFASTQIRVIAGAAGFVLIFSIARRWHRVAAALRERRAMVFVAVGAFCGPFLAVSLSLVAAQLTHAGVAAAIMSTTPILLIPLVVILYRERIGIGGILGALLAVGGVAILFAV